MIGMLKLSQRPTAVPQCQPQRRRMERVTLSGDKPFGPEDPMLSAGLVKRRNERKVAYDGYTGGGKRSLSKNA